jgi:hypothetical protein
MRPLPVLLRVIGVAQLFFGVLFVLAPTRAGDVLGLGAAPPGWASWLFVMLGARFLGFAAGMFWAARDPGSHVGWIDAMIGVQALDWIGTLAFLAGGSLPMPNVASAVVLPVVFVVGLLWWHPRRARAAVAITG